MNEIDWLFAWLAVACLCLLGLVQPYFFVMGAIWAWTLLVIAACAPETPSGTPEALQETTAYMNYTTLREANRARQAEWDTNNQITLAYRGNELAGEVGEACNVIKKLERERLGIRGSRTTLQRLREELADVIICCDLIASAVDIDLDDAVREKFNATSEQNGLSTRLVALQPPLGFGEKIRLKILT